MRLNISSDGNASQGMKALLDAATDLAPVHEAFGQVAVTGTINRFEAEEDPDGNPWKVSARVQAFGGKTMQDTGAVKDSINYQVEADGVYIGSPFGWLIVHQEGWTIHAKNGPYLKFGVGGGFAQVASVTMPQRVIFGISSEDEKEFEEILAAHFGEAA